MIDRGALLDAFTKRYGRAARLFRAPGRVNLIGEHTDYNDGFVLPMAIECETVIAAAVRDDRRVRAFSLNVNEAVEFDLDQSGRGRRGHWLDYVEGVARVLENRSAKLRGADLMILSDVPAGSGLSSSAALEVSTGLALAMLSEIEIDRVTLALAGQQAEHEYVGTMCGIMDQFIAARGRAGHALLIDCRTLEATHIPLDTSQIAIVICDTNVKHELSSSEYNARRAECEHGVQILREVMPGITALRDVSVAEFARYEDRLPEPIRRRCRHVVTENERTLLAAEALKRGCMKDMGALMNLSHVSLRDDYKVSCVELDRMVEIAGNCDGVMGARMTGGGFGGSTVNIVRRDAVEAFRGIVSSEYARATGIDPHVYVTGAGEGAEEVMNAE